MRRIVYFGLLFLVVVAAPRYSWLSLAAAATAVFVLVHEVRFNGAPVISGLLWCLSGALCGGFLVVAGTSSQFGSVKGKEGLQQAPVIWRGRVEGFVERTRWGTRWVMTCPGNDSGKCLAQSRGKTSSRLLPGDLVVINGKVQKPDSAMNPHEFAYDEYLRARSIKGIVVVRQFRLIGKSLRPVDLVLRPVGRIRYRVSDLLGSPEVSASSRAVLSALLLGERSTVTARQRRLFTRTGTAHLLAVSGLHLACFFLFALWLTERIPVATKLGGWMLWRHFIAWSAALLFMLLAYWPTSCVRAGIMLTGYLMARLLNRDFDAWSWLIVSGLCILAVRPDALSEPGYQLSTVAAGALILVFSAPREDWPVQAGPDLPNPVIEWVYRYMRGIVLGTTVATMATMPLVWYHFGVITPVGLAANLVAVPVVSLLVLPCAIGGLVVGMLVPASTPYTMNLLNELLFILGAFLEWVESSDCYWMPPWPGLFLALVLSVIILGNFLARSKSSRLAYGLALIAWGMVVFLPQGTQRSAGTTVRFFHTGNSDASLLTLPCGHHLLIDGGGPGSGNRVLFPYLRREGISRIERMVLSHGHVDHWQGLMDEGGEIRLCEIIINGSQESIKAAEELAGRHSGCDGKETHIRTVRAGDQLSVCGRKMDFLWPPANSGSGWCENDRSLVFRLSFPAGDLIYAGDLEGKKTDISSLTDSLRETYAPKPDSANARRYNGLRGKRKVLILKAPHHGGKSPAFWELASSVSPSVLVITANPGRVWKGGESLLQIMEKPAPVSWVTGSHGVFIGELQGDKSFFHYFPTGFFM